MKPNFALIVAPFALALAACAVPLPQDAPSGNGTSAQTQTSSASSSESSVRARTGSAALLTERALSGGVLELGSADAPHVLTAYVNYGSDYARSFLAEQLPRLTDDFVLPGDLRVRLVPLRINKYPQSDPQAMALACAAQQGKGVAMHESLLTSDTLPVKTALTALKIDATTYQTCIDSPATRTLLEDQRLDAERRGVRYVPVFFLDDERFEGLQEYPDLRGRVEATIKDERFGWF